MRKRYRILLGAAVLVFPVFLFKMISMGVQGFAGIGLVLIAGIAAWAKWKTKGDPEPEERF